jgi:hypothetical protein
MDSYPNLLQTSIYFSKETIHATSNKTIIDAQTQSTFFESYFIVGPTFTKRPVYIILYTLYIYMYTYMYIYIYVYIDLLLRRQII